MARIKMVVSGGMRAGDHDSALSAPYAGRVPTRCAFQFSATDGGDETFPVEYVMRMMSDWARNTGCDPYVKIQNTGVSVLLQGFFDPPYGAVRAPLSSEQCNVVLGTTESTGLTLSDVDRMKAAFGVDDRPFQACLSVSCFVRLPRVQLAFRFMGPSDPGRTARLVDAANESYMADLAESCRKASARSSMSRRQSGGRGRARRSSSDVDEFPPVDDAKKPADSDETARTKSAPSAAAGSAWMDKVTNFFASAFQRKPGKVSEPHRAQVQFCWTVCVTSAVTLAMLMGMWCIKDFVSGP